jgi:radical SAM protein with 4Fe4S-binding SPASM domain
MLRIILLWKLLGQRKIGVSRVANFAKNQMSYFLKRETASRSPSILIVEPTNVCNIACYSCRDENNKIYNHFYKEHPETIPLGKISIEVYKSVIDELKDDILIAVLYVQGEPLLYKGIYGMIKYATERNVPTMTATNGMPLTIDASRKLVENGLDFIKIAVSGFTQKTYGIYHIGGDIEVIKENIKGLVNARNEKKSHLYIMIDYILFDYNRDEFSLFKEFCEKLGIKCITRHGLLPISFKEGNVEMERVEPKSSLCDWLWHVAVINWDGSVWPCCQFPVASDPITLGNIDNNGCSLKSIWNSEKYRSFRRQHIRKGRSKFFVCDRCDWEGVGLQALKERKPQNL